MTGMKRITEFQQKVYSLCRRIPRGRITTYKEIGRALGSNGLVYRAVGNALNKNPFAPVVPCHRVVKSDGTIGGFAFGGRKKILFLRKEGVEVMGNKIIDFGKRLFRF